MERATIQLPSLSQPIQLKISSNTQEIFNTTNTRASFNSPSNDDNYEIINNPTTSSTSNKFKSNIPLNNTTNPTIFNTTTSSNNFISNIPRSTISFKQQHTNNFLSILIVDDSRAYTTRLKKILTLVAPKLNAQIHIDSMTDPNQALHTLQNRQFSFVLIDNIFNDGTLSGVELCHRLSSREQRYTDTGTNTKISPRILISGQSIDLEKEKEKNNTDDDGILITEKFMAKSQLNIDVLYTLLKEQACFMSKFDATSKLPPLNIIIPLSILSQNGEKERKKREAIYDELVWAESMAGTLSINRDIINETKTLQHRQNQRDAFKRAQSKYNFLDSKMSSTDGKPLLYFEDISSDDDSYSEGDSSDDEEEIQRKQDKVAKIKLEKSRIKEQEKQEEKEYQKAQKLKHKLAPKLTPAGEICRAIKEKDMKCLLRSLVKHPESIDAVGENGLAALHVAAGIGDYEMCDILLAHGADVNNATEGHYTPYSHALNSCSKGIGCTQQILDLLKRYGAELATESKVEQYRIVLEVEQAERQVISDIENKAKKAKKRRDKRNGKGKEKKSNKSKKDKKNRKETSAKGG